MLWRSIFINLDRPFLMILISNLVADRIHPFCHAFSSSPYNFLYQISFSKCCFSWTFWQFELFDLETGVCFIQVHLNLSNQTDRELFFFEVWLSQDTHDEKAVTINGLQTMVTFLLSFKESPSLRLTLFLVPHFARYIFSA